MTATAASCLECGETISGRELTPGAVSCPTCGSGFVRGLPAQPQTTRDTTRCVACDATFPRRQAATDVKGALACPECGAQHALEPIDRRREADDR